MQTAVFKMGSVLSESTSDYFVESIRTEDDRVEFVVESSLTQGLPRVELFQGGLQEC